MKKDNINFITLLNVISAIAVVILHTNGCFWTFSKERYWITANIIECICYFAVPIFFMITGATLINYQERYTTKDFFKKRIMKVGIPFILWSIIGMLFYYLYMTKTDIKTDDIHSIINSIINAKYIGIYWFFTALFCIYLIIPLYSSVENNKKMNIFKYMIVIGSIFNIIIPFLNNVLKLNYQLPITIAAVSGYMIYPIVGYVINNENISKKKQWIIYLLGAIGLLLHIIGTWYLSYENGYIIKSYKGYSNLPCFLYSIAVFTFFKYNGEKIFKYKYLKKIIGELNKYTFAIYLEHFFIMEILKNYFNTLSIFYRLFMPFVIIAMCCILTYVMRKIKYLKVFVPE